jgi:hypothetical protein
LGKDGKEEMKQRAKSKQTEIGVIPEDWKKVEANGNKFDFVFFIGKKRIDF